MRFMWIGVVLISLSNAAEAAFTVTFSSSVTNLSSPLAVAGDPSALPGTTVSISGAGITLFTPISVASTNGGSTATAIEIDSPYGSIFSALATSFNIATNPGNTGIMPDLTITISQDAYSFSPVQNQFNTFFTASSSGSFTNTTLDYSTTAGTSTISTNGLSLSSPVSFEAYTAFSPSGTTISQTFTIYNLNPGQILTFSTLSSVTTPLPASALAFGAGLPLLGLAGFVRRRLFA